MAAASRRTRLLVVGVLLLFSIPSLAFFAVVFYDGGVFWTESRRGDKPFVGVFLYAYGLVSLGLTYYALRLWFGSAVEVPPLLALIVTSSLSLAALLGWASRNLATVESSLEPVPAPESGGYAHDPPEADSPRRSCLEKPAVRDMMAGIRDTLIGNWSLPDGLSPDQSVVAHLQLEPSGREPGLEVVEATHPRIEASIRRAFDRSKPFPALSGETSCLAGFPLRLRFSNPVAPETS